MEERQIKIVCGMNNETSILLKERLQEIAAARGIKLDMVSRYRKEGVLQFLSEHRDYCIVILQEIMQSSSPYTAEDVALLTDERDVKVIIVLDKSHEGNRYMRVLYAAGVLNALYEEDAYAEAIIDLIQNGRSRKEARRYYGIPSTADVEQTMEIIDDARMNSYISYIDNGGPFWETESRYEFIARRLGAAENLFLAKHLSAKLEDVLYENELFCYYRDYGKKKERKRFVKRDKEVLTPDVVSPRTSDNDRLRPAEMEIVKESAIVEEYVKFSESEGEDKVPVINIKESAPEDSFGGKNDFHEDETLFDLFGENGSNYIINLFTEDLTLNEQVTANNQVARKEPVQKSQSESVNDKKEHLPNEESDDVRIYIPTRRNTVPVRRAIQKKNVYRERKTDSKIKGNERNGGSEPKGSNGIEEGNRQPRTKEKKKFSDKTLVTAAALLVFLLVMGGGYFVRQYYLYWEKESPVIEHIPVLDGSEGQNIPEQVNIILLDVTDPVKKMESTNEEHKIVQEGNQGMGEIPGDIISEEQQEPSVGLEGGQENKEEVLTEGTTFSEPSISEEPVNDTVQRQDDATGTSDFADLNQQSSEVESAYSIQTEYASEEGTIQDHQDGLSLDEILGDIFSGEELAKVISFIRNQGFRVFIRTKQTGEWEFSREQIDAFCNPSYSYLATRTDERILFVEQ